MPIEPEDAPPSSDWRRRAHVAGLIFLGVSAFGFWLTVAAHVWLGARPFGRLVWEPPATAEAAVEGSARR